MFTIIDSGLNINFIQSYLPTLINSSALLIAFSGRVKNRDPIFTSENIIDLMIHRL